MQGLDEYTKNCDQTDVCVYCGQSECDKIALPLWLQHPERNFEGDMCHSDCEKELMEELNART